MERLFLSIETSCNGELIPALCVARATPDMITSVLSLSKKDYEVKVRINSEVIQTSE